VRSLEANARRIVRATLVAVAGLVAAGFAGVPVARAQEVRVTSSLERELVYVGDSVALTVTLEGAAVGAIEADLPEVPGLRIEGPLGPSQSSFTSIVNGRVSEKVTTTFTYRVTGAQEGTYEIPAFEVTASGRSHRVGPHRLVVAVPPKDERIFLRASLDKTSAYPREPVELRYVLYFSKPIRDHVFSIPLLEDTTDLHIGLVAPVPGRPRADASVRGFRGTFPVERGSDTVDGSTYQTWTLRLRLHPAEPGVLRLPAAGVAAELVLGEKTEVRRDWFGVRRRVPVAEVTTARASSEPIELAVKDFPAEGRPAGFYGLVGDFTIETEADRTTVKVGDPIRLRIRVSGQGVLESVERPVLSRVPEFADFKIDDDLSPGEREGDSIVFEQKIRARGEATDAIPPVPLPYFNFVTEEYVVARSEPIAIDVLPTSVVTAEDIEGRSGGMRPYVEKTELEERSEGLNSNYLYLDALEDRRLRADRLAWLLAAPALYLLLALGLRIRRARTSDVAATRARGARRAALRELDLAARAAGPGGHRFHDALSTGLRRFFRDRFALGEGEITAVEIERLRDCGKIGEGEAAEARELLGACDAGRFGAGAASEDDRGALLGRARKLIEELSP
jgi:hypothetical protein